MKKEDWIVPGLIARRKLTVIVGHGDTPRVALALRAAIEASQSKAVVWWNYLQDVHRWPDLTLARLRADGWDAKELAVVAVTPIEECPDSPTPVEPWCEWARQKYTDLIVIDSWCGFLRNMGLDSDSAEAGSLATRMLYALAHQADCAVMVCAEAAPNITATAGIATGGAGRYLSSSAHVLCSIVADDITATDWDVTVHGIKCTWHDDGPKWRPWDARMRVVFLHDETGDSWPLIRLHPDETFWRTTPEYQRVIDVCAQAIPIDTVADHAALPRPLVRTMMREIREGTHPRFLRRPAPLQMPRKPSMFHVLTPKE